MEFANATNLNRKSGGAKPRDLQFRGPILATRNTMLKHAAISSARVLMTRESGVGVLAPHKPKEGSLLEIRIL